MKRILSAVVLLVVCGLSLAAFGPDADAPAAKSGTSDSNQNAKKAGQTEKNADQPGGISSGKIAVPRPPRQTLRASATAAAQARRRRRACPFDGRFV